MDEMEGCRFPDRRLATRACKLIEQMAAKVGGSIAAACQDWANVKAAYRFFSNEAISEAEILGGHFAATKERIAQTGGTVLILHDTTEFSYKREANPSSIGLLHRNPARRKMTGKLGELTIRGILLHSSLAITTEGLPLGLAAVKLWTRDKFKGCNALKRKVNPTRVPIEEKESYRWLENLRQATELAGSPERCVHIGDRESDIYELFCTAREEETHFLVRTCVDRLAGAEGQTVAAIMENTSISGLHRIVFHDRWGEEHEAVLELKFREIEIRPPVGKQNRYPTLRLTVIHARERGTPSGRESIEWKLITSLKVRSRAEAIQKLEWYALRWKIETFHKILKSGCKAEESKLRTSERLANFIAVCCIVSWRVFWITMLNRTSPSMPASTALTPIEIKLLDELDDGCLRQGGDNKTLGDYLLQLAKLGGYLARAHDPPPGNLVIWRGLRRIADIQIGFLLGSETCG